MTNHIEKLLKEPLLWVCGIVLCIPLLGSNSLLHLRDALTIDSGNAEVVELDRNLVAYPEEATAPSSDSNMRDSMLADSGERTYSTPSSPPFPEIESAEIESAEIESAEIESAEIASSDFESTDFAPYKSETPEIESESESDSIFDESEPISLPGPESSEFASNDPEPPARDPGSLFELTEAGEFDSNSESPVSPPVPEPLKLEPEAAKNQDQEFDFLFGDEEVTSQPAPSLDGNPPAEAPDAFSGQPSDMTAPSGEGGTNQFIPDANEPPPAAPSIFHPPEFSQPLDAVQPQIIGQAPVGQAMPTTQQYPSGSFQPNPVAMEASIYSEQTAASTADVTYPHQWTGPGHVTPGYAIGSGPTYQNVAPVSHVHEQNSHNWIASVSGLFFQRDYEDNVRLASNSTGDNLSTNDADEQTFDGYGLSLASRNSSGSGIEASYWALNPGSVTATISGQITPTITNLDQLVYPQTGDNLFDIYSYAVSQSVTRDTDINNLELNLLRQGGSYCRWNRQGYRELFGGFRWFEFSESLQYATFTDTASYTNLPSEFYYNLQARNRLLGLQGGVRNELKFGSKLRFFSSVQGGIFNNNIRTMQNITDVYGDLVQVNAGPGTGRPFSYNDEKNDVAYLGELNFGINLHLSYNTRLRLGYRVLGVSGVALAANQLPFRYDNPEELLRAKSNSSLLLHGGFYGIEVSF